MKTLHFKYITKTKLQKEWNFLPLSTDENLLITCDKWGGVNFEKCMLYSLAELRGKRIIIH